MYLQSARWSVRGAIVASVMLGGCATIPPNAGAARESNVDAAAAAMQRYGRALRGAPADSVAAFFAPDGALVLPGMAPLTGPVEVRAFLGPLAKAVTVDSVVLTPTRAVTEGERVALWGKYRQVVSPRGAARQAFAGEYVALWQRTTSGRWEIERLVMVPGPAAAL